ncbi:TAXI family TRAP transporter solute-binding subunit [Variovorax rhizosphaerae]|uniref:TAXI family TRAP transporter solute-binding subunit n=1 Tax=Variovorax rhizosphaerae TaxID=1836200 RepID=A0ABU8WUS9_9BURK
MRHLPWKPSAISILWAIVVVGVLCIVYRLVDPLPPRQFTIAAGIPGTTYDVYARKYAAILARDGVDLKVRNYPSAIQHFVALRDSTSGVQAALTNFSFTQPGDAAILQSLGGISDTPIFIFFKGAEPLERLAQLRGKRIAIGLPGSALRALMLDVLRATGAWDDSIHLADLDYSDALQALKAGTLDVAMIPAQIDDPVVRSALDAADLQLMNAAQADAVAKTVPGLKHVVLSRGLISLSRDIPSADVDMLALHNRLLVRNDLHPALQYLLLRAMREVHGGPGPFNRLGEFPAEQSGDLPLSPTAEAFYRSGPSLWQQYTSFWLSSLLNRIGFFVIPILATLIPLLGVAPRIYKWLHLRPVGRWHRGLTDLERDVRLRHDDVQWEELSSRVAEADAEIGKLRLPRAYESELHLLRLHLRSVQDLLAENAPLAGRSVKRPLRRQGPNRSHRMLS